MLSDSEAVTESTGLALPASEKNAALEGTLANRIELLDRNRAGFARNEFKETQTSAKSLEAGRDSFAEANFVARSDVIGKTAGYGFYLHAQAGAFLYVNSDRELRVQFDNGVDRLIASWLD